MARMSHDWFPEAPTHSAWAALAAVLAGSGEELARDPFGSGPPSMNRGLSLRYGSGEDRSVNMMAHPGASALTGISETDGLAARLAAVEMAFVWLFERVARDTLSPDHMRLDFSADMEHLGDRLVQAAVAQRAPDLSTAVRAVSALKSLAQDLAPRG